jgi:nucleoside-diphosphate-sugar epimerase
MRWWQGDLADPVVTRNLLGAINPDMIFHLTTHGWGAPGLEHVLPTLESDLVATVNLLTVATELNTGCVIMTASLEEPQSNDPDLVLASPYAVAKWACSTYARMFHQLYQTPVVLTRIFMTYGPGQPAQKLIPYVIRSLLRGEIPRLSDGQRLLDWVYVDDVIAGLLAAAQAPDMKGRTVDIGSGTVISIREVVEQVSQLLRAEVRASFGALPPRPVGPTRAANTSDAYQKLGWRPLTSLEEGLGLTIDWYRAQLRTEGSR